MSSQNQPPQRPALSHLKPYIPGKSIDEAKDKAVVSSIIKLASNENPLGPSPAGMAALQKAAAECAVYPDQKATILRQALAARYNMGADEVIIGNGSDEIMLLLAQAFLSAGDEVVLSENTFSVYEHVTRLMDGIPKFIPLKNSTYDLTAMAAAVSPKTRMIFLCNPNNPTGTIFRQNDLETFLKKVPESVIVVIDEAYAEYATDKEYPQSLDFVREGKNVIVLRTFSKIYGLAGLRVGYGIARASIIKPLTIVKMPFNVNRLAQAAATAALEDASHVQKSQKLNREGIDTAMKAVKAMGLSALPTQANFICIDLGDRSADTVFLELMRRGVIIRPLTSFGMPNAIRVTIGTPDQIERFLTAFKEVLAL